MENRAIDVAITQLGVKEKTGNNDGVPAQRYMRGDRLPWCAAFCLYCNSKSDELDITTLGWDELQPHQGMTLSQYKTKHYYPLRNVGEFERTMKKYRMWFPPPWKATGADEKPRRGDYVFFSSRGNSDKGRGRHMGVVFRAVYDVETRELVSLITIEGNVRNAVKKLTHDMTDPKKRKRVTGFARVPPLTGLLGDG